jgi:ABC-2 type transport system ATP-binding protein
MMRVLTCFFPHERQGEGGGYDCFEDSLEVRKRIGYLPERVPPYDDMKVADHSPSYHQGNAFPRSRPEGHRIMADCGLADVSGKPIGAISKGYRQRVGIAQALVNDPEVLILDEPTAGLDPRQIKEIRRLIKDLAGKHTVILSTHILPEVSLLCGRVIIIDKGKLVAVDRPENLTSESSRRMFLRIDGEAQAIEQELSRTDGLRSVAREQAPDGASGFIVVLDDERRGRQGINAMIERNHWDLLEMRPVETSLEDVFIKLVTREEA